ncbi:MAG TPA: TonB-dependent siderophore receptor [Candidatus Polarisedimenticolia bacterium]|jgi:TonB-dependent siderophore receptor
MRRLTLILAVTLLLGTPAAAREEAGATAQAEEPKPIPPVSVTVEGSLPYVPTSNTILTRLALPLRLTPANVGSVNDLVLHEQYALVLGEALRNISGVNVQTVSDVADYFLIRGFDSLSSGLVLTDGAAEPEVAFYQMYNVERVEVLKGPGGFLYGSNPLAGAVNIVRRQPVPGTFGHARGTYGSFQTYDGALDFNTSTRDGGFAFRVDSTWRESDSYRDDKENRVSAVNPAFTWRIGGRSSLNLNLEYADTEHQPDSGLPLYRGRIADVPRTRSYQSPFDKSDQQIGRVQIDFETRLSDAWTVRNKAYYRDLDWSSDGTLFNGVFPSQTTGRPEVSRTLTLLDDRQRFVGDQIEAVWSAGKGTVQHKVLAGLEVARYGDDFTLDIALLPSIDLKDPDETASKPLFILPPDPNVVPPAGDSRSIVIAPYVIDQMRFSEKLHALAGARFDRIDFEDEVSGAASEDGEISPMGGIVYTPTATLSFYANAGKSFSPPSSRVAGEREPERSLQYEVGARLERPGGKLQATLAAYHMERENIAIPDDNGITQQAGDQRSRGVEVELAAEPLPRLRTFVSYAWNLSELTRFTERVVVGVDPNTFQPIYGTEDRSGNVPAFAPRHLASLWVSRGFGGGLNLAGGARWVSEQFIAEDNLFRIDGYVTLDSALSWTRGDWEMTLNLKNLTNRRYETRGFGSTSVIPAPRFTAYAGVQYNF